jgi:hypothetical protein
MSNAAARLLAKINQCIDYQTIYALEDDFNKAGLTIQTTSTNRVIICKLRGGRPVAAGIVDDYIFIGSLAESTRELTERAVEKICDFVRNNAGKADIVKNMARSWRNGLRMYEASIAIVNEDVDFIGDSLDTRELFYD